MLPYIIVGLTAGSVYALGGLGLVLTYKTSRIFNFAYGALATAAAYLFYFLHIEHGMNWAVAGVISIVVVGVVMGMVFEPLARALTTKSLALQVVATVGILLVIQAFGIILYGQTTRQVPEYFPTGSFKLFDAVVTYSQAITVGVVTAFSVILYVFFRRTRLGVSTRGVVDNSDLLDLSGTNPRRVRRSAWIIGSLFAALSGVLLLPTVGLDPNVLTLLVVETFGAAAIGAFANLPATYAGGLGIGVAASLITKYVQSPDPLIAGIAPSLPFLVLFAAMLFMPKRWLTTPHRVIPVASPWLAPLRVQITGGVVALGVLIVIPDLVGFRIIAWTFFAAFAILFLSLGLLVRVSGQVSLCQMSFAAIGACAFSHFSSADMGMPWIVALLAAGLIAMPVGALLAIPAIRQGGLYLPLATFGFGLLFRNMFYRADFMFGLFGVNMPRPHLSWITLDDDRGFYYVCLAILALSTILVLSITHSRLGRLLRAMADSPLALTTNGTSVTVTRVLVFAIAAFLAAIAGALFGMTNQIATSDSFDPITSLLLVAIIVISLGNLPWCAMAAAAGYVLVPVYVQVDNISAWLQLLFGASALLVALNGQPPLSPKLIGVLERIGRRKRPAPGLASSPTGLPPTREPVSAGTLEVVDLRIEFGGLVAVDGLSLVAPTGRITGLIGPNGAGKTTTFNACCGMVTPKHGRIVLDGHDVTRMATDARARRGLGRTFQQVELFDSLSVAQNVRIGAEAALAGMNPVTQFVSRRGDAATIDTRSREAMQLCRLDGVANSMAGSLSTGQRRLVELARCLAGPFRFLLLDEPSSGLDRTETREFGQILRRVVEERGVGILLVEHDMELVMEVCEHIYVLDFGVPIFDGAPHEVTSSPVVQSAYFGTESAALNKLVQQ